MDSGYLIMISNVFVKYLIDSCSLYFINKWLIFKNNRKIIYNINAKINVHNSSLQLDKTNDLKSNDNISLKSID